MFDANNGSAYVTPAAAANPGDTLILWGSGLGASAGDETKYPFPQVDLTARSNVRVYIGGVQAQVSYAGRSQFPGLDQINVIVPAGVTGCSVGIIVQTGNYVSNSATTSVAASGRTCSDQATNGLTPSDFQNLLNKGTIRVGFIGVNKITTQTPPISVGGITVGGSTIVSDSAVAGFSQYTAAQITNAAGFSTTSLGSCTTFQYQGQAGTTPPITLPVALDAGAMTMRLPSGSTMNMPKTGGFYVVSGSNAQGSPSPLFIPDAGGQFSFTNTGGADVGQISNAQITVPPAINWTNMSSISTINRAQGVTVNWDRSNPYSGFVTIGGTSFNINGTNTTSVTITGFTCTAPYSAGTFTVQPYVLLSLIAGSGSVGGVSIPTGSLSLTLNAQPVTFNAPSIDYASMSAGTGTGKSVTYQ